MSTEAIQTIDGVQVSFPVGGLGRRAGVLGVAGVSFDFCPGETFVLLTKADRE